MPYHLLNHARPLREPRFLELNRLDLLMPVMPQMVWIYLSAYLFVTGAFAYAKDANNLKRFFFSLMSVEAVSLMIYIIYPTTIQREHFLFMQDLKQPTKWAFQALYSVDLPVSCFPSLHVASTTVGLLLIWRETRLAGKFLAAIWAIAIAVSTVATKQHYTVDAIAGAVLAAAIDWAYGSIVIPDKERAPDQSIARAGVPCPVENIADSREYGPERSRELDARVSDGVRRE